MTLFDLLFILLFLLAVFSVFFAVYCALRRQFIRARRVLWRLIIGAFVYMLIVIDVSVVVPRRVISMGEPQCFDDWCISVDAIHKVPEGERVRYTTELQLSSRALGVSQREKNLAVYLTDKRGRRYDPLASASDIPFDVLLQPHESKAASRTFQLPADATNVAVVIAHEGGFPIGWFIVGYDTWFRKPPLLQVP
jgi:hypothetical protein